MLATDALVIALEIEGWMTRFPRQSHSGKTEHNNVISLAPVQHSTDKLVPLKLAA